MLIQLKSLSKYSDFQHFNIQCWQEKIQFLTTTTTTTATTTDN